LFSTESTQNEETKQSNHSTQKEEIKKLNFFSNYKSSEAEGVEIHDNEESDEEEVLGVKINKIALNKYNTVAANTEQSDMRSLKAFNWKNNNEI
jgi:hypothetical protein